MMTLKFADRERDIRDLSIHIDPRVGIALFVEIYMKATLKTPFTTL